MTIAVPKFGGVDVPSDDLLQEPVQFADAVRPHMTDMFRLAARLTPSGSPDDVVQNALVRAWKYRSTHDARRGTVRSWLLGIVANEARRAAIKARRPVEAAPWRGPATSLDDRLDVEQAVQRLPNRQRLAVNCYYFTDLSIAETALVMNCSEGTVKSTLSDARANLRSLLEGSR